MSMWPKIEHGGYATQHLVTRPDVRVSAVCYLPGVKSPLHVHSHHDQCICIAQGEMKIITDQGRKMLQKNVPVIIPSNTPHSFESGTEEVRFLSVFLGEGASEPGKTTLPEKVSRLIDPTLNKHEKLVETFLSPEHVSELEALSEAETETLVWVVDRLLKRLETGQLKKRPISVFRKPRRAQSIKAWHRDNSLFLFSPNLRQLYSLVFNTDSNSHDYINFNNCDIYWKLLDNYPKVKTI